MSDPLLSSLCSICHGKPHKYRCPRCSTLTCSLTCIKRHKQWAECNGVRDPTIYIKQKDLATPKGIDHDYNYLTSIERELDHAERNATSRGVILEDYVRPKEQRYEKGEKALEAAFERCGVIVARAPKGMSRSKLNRTKVTAKTRVLRWTVEWVRPDGSKTLGVCSETQPVAAAYNAHLNWLNPDRSSKRRKQNHEVSGHLLSKPELSQGLLGEPPCENPASTDLSNAPDSTASVMEPSQAAQPANDHKGSVSEEPVLTHSQQRKRRRKGQIERASSTPKAKVGLESEQQLQEWMEGIINKRKAEETQLEDAIEAANEKERLEKEKRERGEPEHSTSNGTTPAVTANSADAESRTLPESTLERSIPPLPEPTPEANMAFYLHHPSLPSRHPVLIPLSPTSTLATSLSNRLVLEFPTIYVLHQQPDGKLPKGFISEEDFFRMAKKELVQELEEGELRNGDEEGSKEEQQDLRREGDVDERRLREVLGRDLNGVTGALC